MEASFVYWVIVLMTFFCGFFVILLLIWNKKNVDQHKKSMIKEKEQMVKLTQASLEGQEYERQRISENLHDDLGPLLSAIKMQMTNAKSDPEVLDKLKNSVDEAVKTIRQVSYDLSPAILEQLGLYRALHHVCSEHEKITKSQVNLQWDRVLNELLSEKEEITIYRIIQEALTNIMKHAQATKVFVSGVVNNGVIEISIGDNGIGINTKDKSMGLGLKNIKARVSVLNGVFKLATSSNGTNLNIKIKRNDTGSTR